jgi:hypothetical protein
MEKKKKKKKRGTILAVLEPFSPKTNFAHFFGKIFELFSPTLYLFSD